MNFYNVNDNESIHSTLFRENFNYTNFECSECIQMDEEQCVINDDFEWIENINTGSCSSLSINECDLPEYGSCYSDCTNWGNYYNGMFWELCIVLGAPFKLTIDTAKKRIIY